MRESVQATRAVLRNLRNLMEANHLTELPISALDAAISACDRALASQGRQGHAHTKDPYAT